MATAVSSMIGSVTTRPITPLARSIAHFRIIVVCERWNPSENTNQLGLTVASHSLPVSAEMVE
jgi:hypothetical protein